MNEMYLNLLKEITHAAEILAERVAEYDKANGDKDGNYRAIGMRNDYQHLNDKLSDPNFQLEQLSRADYAKLYICALSVVNNLEAEVQNYQKALKGYKIDLLPKLSRMLEETENHYQAVELAKDLFK